jgi:uncharacterized repeat protein (TIGR01451 family)
VAGLLISGIAAATTPGTPGTPQAPTTVFTEDFENNPPASNNGVLLTSYTGASGQTYTASTSYLTGCDGQVMNAVSYDASGNPIYLRTARSNFAASNCDNPPNPPNLNSDPDAYGNVVQEAYALGLLRGLTTSAAAANHSLTELTASTPAVNDTMLQTVSPITLAYTNRFLTFQVNAAAINCQFLAPLLKFSLINGATTIPLFTGSGINACTSTNYVPANGTGTPGASNVQDVSVPAVTITGYQNPSGASARTVHVGTYVAASPNLYTGSSVGILVQNGQSPGSGNDGSIDNLVLLDVSPQLDKAFNPTSVPVGGTSTLTLTVTNTNDLLAKNGWSFTDTLPAGLTITTPAATTTCSSPTLTAGAGTSTIAMTGSLAAGVTSCTITVNVTSTVANTYTNTGCVTNTGTVITPCTSNFALSGLNPPGTATVTFYTAPGQGAPFDCTNGSIYTLQRGSTTTGTGAASIYSINTIGLGTTVTDTFISTAPTGSGFTNGFGITKGGLGAYIVDQNNAGTGTTAVYGYNALTGTWSTYTGTAPAVAAQSSLIGGAIDPTTGIFYYGSFTPSAFANPLNIVVYGFNTNTNTAISGIIGTITLSSLPTTSGNPNGDLAFDANGNLYYIATAGTSALLAVVKGPLPTTGSASGVALTSTTLANYTNASSLAYNGIAFDNAGHLFVQYATGTATSNLIEINPNTGATIAGPTTQTITPTPTFANVDLASCSYPPTLTLQKNILRRAQTSDQFGLSVTGGGITSGNTATTSGTSSGLQSAVVGPLLGLSGTTYSLAETATNNNLSAYTTTYSCLDTANGSSSVASGSTQSFNLSFPTPTAGQNAPQVVCTLTNDIIPNVAITKTDSNGGKYTPGGTNTYTITVTNTGGAANSLILSDVLPKGLTLTTSITTASCNPAANCSGSGQAAPFVSDGSTNVLAGLLLNTPAGSVATPAQTTITVNVSYASSPSAY